MSPIDFHQIEAERKAFEECVRELTGSRAQVSISIFTSSAPATRIRELAHDALRCGFKVWRHEDTRSFVTVTNFGPSGTGDIEVNVPRQAR